MDNIVFGKVLLFKNYCAQEKYKDGSIAKCV
jgi:hypothetical protein